jgi:hypothetical protein
MSSESKELTKIDKDERLGADDITGLSENRLEECIGLINWAAKGNARRTGLQK